MKLYYTTSAGTGEPQKKTSLSLGGYRSSTVVPNGRVESLFGDISGYTIQTNREQLIGVFLKNETGGGVTGIKLHFLYNEKCYSKLEIGAIEPSTDNVGENIIERVQDMYSLPYSVDFYEAEEEENAVELGDLTDGQELGLYFKRSLLMEKIKEDYSNLYEKQGDTYNPIELEKEDEVKIIISWD